MTWIPVQSKIDGWQEKAEGLVDELKEAFTDQESSYLKRWVNHISFHERDGLGGYYDWENNYICVNPLMEDFPLFSKGNQPKFNLAHELSHPLFALAGQDGTAGYLIIPEDKKKEAQAAALRLFPTAVQAIECILDLPRSFNAISASVKLRPFEERIMTISALEQLDLNQFTPCEIFAMRMYLILDDRYYDMGGSTLMAHVFSGGYTASRRPHEIACNLRALRICEPDIIGNDYKGESYARQIAGPIYDLLDAKFQSAYQKNPDRHPHPPKPDGPVLRPYSSTKYS